MIQDQPLYTQDYPKAVKQQIENLLLPLRFVDTCFGFLPYPKTGKTRFSLTYYYSDTQEFDRPEDLIFEIKRCVDYQVECGRDISFTADVNVGIDVDIDGSGVELFYHGGLLVHHTFAMITFNWYQSTPSVEIQLAEPATGESFLTLSKNLQEAIKDQLANRNHE